MNAARSAVAVVVLAILLATVAACSRPLPQVNVVAGSKFYSIGANIYCFDARQLQRGTCPQSGAATQTVHLGAGDNLGIEVPQDVARSPWVAFVRSGKNTQRTELQNAHSYIVLTPQQASAKALTVEVVNYRTVAVGKVAPTGRWTFNVVRGR